MRNYLLEYEAILKSFTNFYPDLAHKSLYVISSLSCMKFSMIPHIQWHAGIVLP